MPPAWPVLLALLAAPPAPTGERIAAAAAAAQALQGPLDGTWLLSAAGGRTLYLFQIVDPVTGGAGLQGAWRDLEGARSGFIDEVHCGGGRLALRFGDQGGAIDVSLRPKRGGEWSGWLRRGDQRVAVTLRRN
jgi:hypothetical protein